MSEMLGRWCLTLLSDSGLVEALTGRKCALVNGYRWAIWVQLCPAFSARYNMSDLLDFTAKKAIAAYHMPGNIW